MEKCFQEAVRYLGYGKNPVDEATSRLVEKGFLELEKVSALRSVFRIFEMNRIDEEKVAIGTLHIRNARVASGQAAACLAGARCPARRREGQPQRGHPHHRRQQQEPP